MSLARVANSALIGFECVLYVQAAGNACVICFLSIYMSALELAHREAKRFKQGSWGVVRGFPSDALYASMLGAQFVSIVFSILLAQLIRRVRLRTGE